MAAKSVSKLIPVSKAHPCPVCGGDHKCSTTADGLILCGRKDGPQDGFKHIGPCADPTWTMYLNPLSASPPAAMATGGGTSSTATARRLGLAR